MKTADKAREKEYCAVVVHGRITDIRGHAMAPIFRLNAFDVLRHFIKRFVPIDLLPSTIGPSHRMFEPIRIVVDVLQSNCFRADVTMTEDIL